MGSSNSTQNDVEPEELGIFKKLPPYSRPIEIPENAEYRKPTDRRSLLIFGIIILSVVPFLFYTIYNSDLDRYSWYDECGNICGKKNIKYDQWNCTGQDFTDKKLLQFSKLNKVDVTATPRNCVSECSSGYKQIFSFCVINEEGSNNYDDDLVDYDSSQWGVEVMEHLHTVAWRLTLACFFPLGVGLTMLYLFRTATAAMVWSILVSVVTFLFLICAFLWHGYAKGAESYGVWAPLFFTILMASLLVVMIFLRKKIGLIVALFKEAMKVTFAIPQLLLIPVIAFVVDSIILGLFIDALWYIYSAGVLVELDNGFLIYTRDILMQLTAILCFWVTFCLAQFVAGIQYMVIAGAVAKWYFAENKNNLEKPILTSVSVTFRFHLGTVALGSMVITAVRIVRDLLWSIMRTNCLKFCFDMCLGTVEEFLKYLSKNAYILTAMHGRPFYKSGKRAAQIILKNVVNLAVLNNVGDFIIFMAHILVVLVSLLFTYLIMTDHSSPHQWTVYAIVAFISFIVAAVCFSIFESAVDTIFLCFCEDTLLNDGMAKPYAMSRDLMEFMENSKKLFGAKKI